MTDFRRDVYCLLGLPFDALDMNGAVTRVRKAARKRLPCFISTPNVNFAIGCRSDIDFRRSVLTSDLCIADGMPLILIARLLGIPIYERVSGSCLFDNLTSRQWKPLSVYFFGGQSGAAQAAFDALNARPESGLVAVGFEDPGMGSTEELSRDESIERINASGADFLVVSLGARKGQAWIEQNRHKLNVPVVSHLGAVVNFIAGRVQRAPGWMQNSGLEWLWRIKEEHQLWRRYLHDGLRLLWLVSTRTLVYAWRLRRNKADSNEQSGMVESEQDGCRIIKLRGRWTHDRLHPLRTAFSTIENQDVRLDLSQVTHVDSAFVGLVMLLSGHQAKQEKRLMIESVSAPVRRVFWYCCADFLYETGTPAPAPAPAMQVESLLTPTQTGVASGG